MKSNLLSILKFLIGWPLSLISLLFVFKIIQPKLPALVPKLSEINLYLLFYGIICFFIYFLLRGILWGQILKLKGYKLPFKKTLFFWNTSELKRYTPGNIWSFLGRTVSFSNLGVKNKDILSSLLFESELIVAGTVIVSLMSLAFIFTIFPDTPLEPIIQPLIIILVVILSCIFIFNPFNLKFLPKFKNIDNLKLLAISSLTFLIWGIGNYLVASSLFLLNPFNFLSFVGFFVFALLVGYLSIITPMGLGVREGVLTFGLSKVLTLEIAGFISIFVRIIFIISELIFLFLAWIWFKSKNSKIANIENFIYKHKHEIILLFLTLSFFLYFANAGILRYDNFYTGRFDLGNMDQTVWNTINGRIFQLTDPNGTDNISRLAFHADFILVLISPLYLVWSNPKILIIFQALIVSFGGIFVFLLAKNILHRKSLSLVFAFIYFINPAVNYPMLFDFHPVVLGTTFILSAFFFLQKRNYLPFIIFIILASLTKENVWIITALFGIYIFIIQKKRILGLSLFMSASLIFYYLIWIAIPQALGKEHFALSYYSNFGDTPTNVVKNVILHPFKILGIFFEPDRLLYLKQLFLPVMFLPILAPLVLIFTAPDLLINLVSSNKQLHQIYYQYSAVVIPFIFIASIMGVKTILNRAFQIPVVLIGFILLSFSVFSAYDFGPLPFAKNPNLDMFVKPLENKQIIENYLEKIPEKSSVSATNNLGSHLSRREYIYTIPYGIDRADVVAFLMSNYYLDNPQTKIELDTFEKVKKDKNYIKVFENKDFTVFKKK